ncbi:MAG: hypothetical protein JWQ74_2917 [Marmoricola sp.]|nr:hypothetical protein [Marmoricola sp.]
MRFPRVQQQSPTLPVLTAAERARTIIATASTLRVASRELTLDVHRHGVVPDGSVLFQAPADFAIDFAGDGVTATAIDVATVPQADRVRGSVTLAGCLYDVVEPLPAGMRMHLTGSEEPDGETRLVRLVPDRIGLAWHCENRPEDPTAQQVSLEDFRNAFPDPLLGYEAEWLPHLQADHAEVLVALARHELGWDEDPRDVRALAIDRYGLVLRARDTSFGAFGHRDLRLAFDRTVACGCDVREAFAAMLDRAMPDADPIC